MNKALAVFLLLAGLVVLVAAKDVPVQVGGDDGSNVFVPAKVAAAPGDNLVFTWKSGKHSIIETDDPKSCVKSAKPTALTSDGAFAAPKEWKATIPKDATGKTWFYCGVPGHCTAGTGGMVVSVILVSDVAGGGGGGDGGNGGSGGSPGGEPTPDNTPTMVGAIIGALIGGIVITIGSFFLYKKFKNKKVILIGEDNWNNRNDYNNNHNLRQIPVSENRNYNDQAISVSENRNYNDQVIPTVYNHGQEAIPISENDNNDPLRNYIIQIVRQEIGQNQRNN